MSWVLPTVVVGYQVVGDVMLDQDRRLWDRLLVRRGLEAFRAPRTPSIVGLLYVAVTPTIGFAYAAAWMVLGVAATVVVRHREPRVTR
jgi:hypothetical protein